jgi:hypothetical protein
LLGNLPEKHLTPLVAMDDDRVWMYAAMIVIYFIAWVLKRIKGLKQSNQEEEPTPEKRTMAEVLENRKRHLERQAGKQTKSNDPSEVLRRLFESIADGTKSQGQGESFLPESEPTSPNPPPLKKGPPPLSKEKAKPRTVAARLSLVEQKALAELNSKEPQQIRIRSKYHPQSLRSMTRGRGLRQAMVLKEILDQPRALRPY